APGRIADHRGKIADQENHRVPVALEIAQLLERDSMAEVQVGRGRIHAELDAQGAAQLELLRQLRVRDYFDGASGQRRRAFVFVALIHRLGNPLPGFAPEGGDQAYPKARARPTLRPRFELDISAPGDLTSAARASGAPRKFSRPRA